MRVMQKLERQNQLPVQRVTVVKELVQRAHGQILQVKKKNIWLAQMIAFRDGARENAQMAPMVANLSDEDIANLAAYYASLGCK